MDYKLLQLTNKSIGAVSVDSNIPLGIVTGRINCPYYNQGAIYYTTSANDTIVIGTCGHYKVLYNSSLTVGTAGNIVLSLVINGTSVYSVSVLAQVGANNVTLAYEFKVKDTIPTNIQLQLGTTALTGGSSNIIIEKVW